jgi:hypothetical protein
VRNAETTRPACWPSVKDLRESCTVAVKAKGFSTVTEALRKVDLSATTLKRLLEEGMSDNTRVSVERKLGAMGVLHLIPRR